MKNYGNERQVLVDFFWEFNGRFLKVVQVCLNAWKVDQWTVALKRLSIR